MFKQDKTSLFILAVGSLLLGATALQAQPMTYTIVDGPGRGTLIQVDGGHVNMNMGQTSGNIQSHGGACPEVTFNLGGFVYTTDAHYHGTLNGASDPNSNGCGWGRVAPGDFSSLFMSNYSSSSYDNISERLGLTFDTWNPGNQGPVILYSGILGTGIFGPMIIRDQVTGEVIYGHSYDENTGLFRKHMAGKRVMEFGGKTYIDKGAGFGWKNATTGELMDQKEFDEIWEGQQAPGYYPDKEGRIPFEGTIGSRGTVGLGADYTPGGDSKLPVGNKPGDYNADGNVDGADYVLWRTGMQQQADSPQMTDLQNNGFVMWQENFGRTTDDPNEVIPGDFNRDGKVNAQDYVVWRSQLQEGTPLPEGDYNNDGDVDGQDFQQFSNNFKVGIEFGGDGNTGTNDQGPSDGTPSTKEVGDRYGKLVEALGGDSKMLNDIKAALERDRNRSDGNSTLPQNGFRQSIQQQDASNNGNSGFHQRTAKALGDLFEEGFEPGNPMKWSVQIP